MKISTLGFLAAIIALQFPAFAQNLNSPGGDVPCPNIVNLINNGDFANGLTGFTTTLNIASRSEPNCAGLSWDGIGVDTIFNTFCAAFPPTTSANATNMAIIDIHSSVAPVVFLRQNIIGIKPGERNVLKLDGTVRFSSHPVAIQVRYDGQLIHTFTLTNHQQFSTDSIEWFPAANAPWSGLLEFVLPTATSFHDFAITNLQLMSCQAEDFSTTLFSQNAKPVIYPNPFSTSFKIESEIPWESWTLIDLNGKICASSSLPQEIEKAAPGMYILEITHLDKSVSRHKIIKTRSQGYN